MKKIVTQLVVGILLLIVPFISTGQVQSKILDKFNNKDVPVLAFQQPDLTVVNIEDEERNENGQMFRIGVPIDVNITLQNSGVWSTEADGNRVWRLKVKYPGAEGLSFMFSKFHLFGNSTIDVYGADSKRVHQTYTSKDVLDHGQQNLSLCEGDYLMLELVEPAGTQASILEMEQIIYLYRGTGFTKTVEKGFGTSESCEVNVNCSEGNNWQDEKRGVARILVTIPQGQAWCTGSLVNNVRQDCTPYFLTAMHCAEGATTSNLNNWRFYFNYEAPGCNNPSSQGSLANYYRTGCVKIAASEDVNGNTISKSDFYLVHIGSIASASATITALKGYNAYWNGWDVNNTASASGVGIHHPDGDIKKISTYTSTVTSTTYSGITANTHWRVYWVSTANGHGVTEGGSSGSPLFNNNGGNSRIVGTLSGGSSYCSAPNQPDVYGKMSYHWISAGTTDALRLKPWLDPDNTGALVLDGSSDPCAASPGAPNANFVANQTNVPTGTTVSFTDLTTGSPTSWSWSISPGTGWVYAGGATAATQNPQVTFNTAGSYTVSLTATNANGSDVETKNNYIVVTSSGGVATPCTATSTTCDEYIAQVQLNTINNSSACNNYTDYSSISTTLNAGSSYTATVVPGIVGYGPNYGYIDGNVIGVWIDYNNNGDFTDANELIGTQIFSENYTGQFNFTVPSGVTSGTVRMRVRIDYSESGTISPCGTFQYGEVEDYRIILANPSNPGVGLEEINLNSISLYPNPASDEVTIDLNSNFQKAEISVLDITGKEVLSSVNNNVQSVNLNLSYLSSGIYQVVIHTEHGSVVKRVSKN